MGQCKYCGNKGFFLPIDKDGLCKRCAPTLALQVNQSVRIIKESNDIINNSKKTATRISRCDTVLGILERLIELENKGIPTLNQSPSALHQTFIDERDTILFEGTKDEVEKVLAKAELATSAKAKLNNANNALLKVFQAKKILGLHPNLTILKKKIRNYIHETQLKSFLDEAQKAEFKSNYKKAMDQYQEALYFLKTDKIDDDLQRSEITQIESKINEIAKKL